MSVSQDTLRRAVHAYRALEATRDRWDLHWSGWTEGGRPAFVAIIAREIERDPGRTLDPDGLELLEQAAELIATRDRLEAEPYHRRNKARPPGQEEHDDQQTTG